MHEAVMRTLSRFALLAALLTGAVVLALFGGLYTGGPTPPEGWEIWWAAYRPAAFRLVAALDLLHWLAAGAALVVVGRVFAASAPIRSALIGACGIGQLLGVIGAYLRLQAMSALAPQYVSLSPEDQAILWPVAALLRDLIYVQLQAALLLLAGAFLLIALLGFSVAGVPRWLAGWAALWSAFTVIRVLAPGPLPLVVGLWLDLSVVGLWGSIAAVYWRGAPRQREPSLAIEAAVRDGRSGSWRMSGEVTPALLVLLALSLFPLLWAFAKPASALTGREVMPPLTLPYLVPVILVVLATGALHELLHGVAIVAFGGRPRLGATGGLLAGIYVTASKILTRDQYVAVALAPLVAISLLGVVSFVASPPWAEFAVVALAVNALCAIGDVWVCAVVVGLPRSAYIRDDGLGFTAFPSAFAQVGSLT